MEINNVPLKPQDEKMIEEIINTHTIDNNNIIGPDYEDKMVIEEENMNDESNANNLNKQASHKKEKVNLIRLPLSKIKNTMKLDKDVKLCQKNAYYLIGRLTELFLQELAKNAYLVCKTSKRKTINIDDINTAIKRNDKFSFIDINSLFYVDTIEKGKSKQKNAISNNNENKTKTTKRTNNKQGKSKNVNFAASNMKIDSMFSKKE